jgi:hypothetical protein
VVAASVARVRSVGGGREGEGEAEPESRSRRRRCEAAGGLRRLSGFRRERSESGEARRREDAIGGVVGRKRGFGGLETTMALSSRRESYSANLRFESEFTFALKYAFRPNVFDSVIGMFGNF